MNSRYQPYSMENNNMDEYPVMIQKIVKNILKLFNKTQKNQRSIRHKRESDET